MFIKKGAVLEILVAVNLCATLVGGTYVVSQLKVEKNSYEIVLRDKPAPLSLVDYIGVRKLGSEVFVEKENLAIKVLYERNKNFELLGIPLDEELQKLVFELGDEFEIDPYFIFGVIYTESRFDTGARSRDSVGLMQINECNFEWIKNELGLEDLFNPYQNIYAGIYILRMLFDKYESSNLVLMAYNHGEGGARTLWRNGIYNTEYTKMVLGARNAYIQ